MRAGECGRPPRSIRWLPSWPAPRADSPATPGSAAARSSSAAGGGAGSSGTGGSGPSRPPEWLRSRPRPRERNRRRRPSRPSACRIRRNPCPKVSGGCVTTPAGPLSPNWAGFRTRWRKDRRATIRRRRGSPRRHQGRSAGPGRSCSGRGVAPSRASRGRRWSPGEGGSPSPSLGCASPAWRVWIRSREEFGDLLGSAFDPEALAGARAVAPWLLDRLPGPAAEGPWRVFLAGADPARAGAALRRAARHLGRVPVLGEREAGRLGRAADLLAPWEGCGELSLEVWRDPEAGRLRICRSAAPR